MERKLDEMTLEELNSLIQSKQKELQALCVEIDRVSFRQVKELVKTNREELEIVADAQEKEITALIWKETKVHTALIKAEAELRRREAAEKEAAADPEVIRVDGAAALLNDGIELAKELHDDIGAAYLRGALDALKEPEWFSRIGMEYLERAAE